MDSTIPLLTKSKISSLYLLCLYSLVCVGPGQNPNCWFSYTQAHLSVVKVMCTKYMHWFPASRSSLAWINAHLGMTVAVDRPYKAQTQQKKSIEFGTKDPCKRDRSLAGGETLLKINSTSISVFKIACGFQNTCDLSALFSLYDHV